MKRKEVVVKDYLLERIKMSQEYQDLFKNAKSIVIPESREELLELTFEDGSYDALEVAYDAGVKGRIVEATVIKAKNGAVVNYPDQYMRRRDPNCMLIADDKPTDKRRYEERYSAPFNNTRLQTIEWLSKQDLIVMPFYAGDKEIGYKGIYIGPRNAGFFALTLADLQRFIPASEMGMDFEPKGMLAVAPPFRHTHFHGDQIVVHNRTDKLHEVFAYNLYPGPSAKKGIYSMLLTHGEKENWPTLHASSVKIITPYDNEMVILHEGASGGGKSEMLEEIHRNPEGRVKYAENQITGEELTLELSDTCSLYPVTDDMALAHHAIQDDSKKLAVMDAEAGWFLRMDHITEYGTSPNNEHMCVHPKGPLIFLNMQGTPGATCLIWEHTMDTPEKRCPNPRVVMPRQFMDKAVKGKVNVDIRSFGVRLPMCTKENPTYGIIGFLHVLSPALAWLWRLVAPRGYGNPSIVDTGGMKSEGVGSYWPFANGKMVTQANILLDQIRKTPETKYVLIPNQHIGAYKVGFHAEWICREYLARRGNADFNESQIVESRSPLLGYALNHMKVDGTKIPKTLLQTNLQLEVGNEGYDKGAQILNDFFVNELKQYMTDDLDPLGRKIIEAFMSGAGVKEMEALL